MSSNSSPAAVSAPMTPDDVGAGPVSSRVLPLVLFLFVGSGCAALIYEIVWFQMLSLNLGSSAISMGVLLGTFMGGMCLGSLLLPRFIAPDAHPLRTYAKLEVAIGVLGLVIYFILPYAGGIYTSIGGPGMGGLFLRGIIAAIVLLPPTMMMGATLPAIARWVEATPRGVSWLGYFYGGNIVGAVLGCLLAGFYLLRVHDMLTATLVAVALNFVVAAAGLTLAGKTAHNPSANLQRDTRVLVIPKGTWPVYLTIALSGATALASEVVWTRLLSLLLGATVYTFSLILAVFLVGLGAGSSMGATLAKSVSDPRRALGICQLLLMLGLAWAAYSLTTALPNWPINPELSTRPLYTFQVDLIRTAWAVLPGAFLWGMSFPLALAGVASREQDPGRIVGSVYAANTVGAIVGAVFASLIAIAWLGTRGAQQLLIVLAGISALVVLAPVVARETGKISFSPRSGNWIIGTLVIAFLLASTVKTVPPILVGYGRYAVTWQGLTGDFIYSGEGMNSSMAVSRMPNGMLNYHNAGKVQASSLPQDMRLQRMLGHLTTLVPRNPNSVLVIGCGAGVTAGAVSISPAVQKVTIAEIEKLVPNVVSQYFSEHNYSVVTQPKVHVQIDDARHFLLTTDQTFDAITSDPFDPWVKGAATLYTREFFELAKEKLNPGGIVTVFVQLYESGMEAVKSEIATFIEVFPNAVVFGNTYEGGGYDVVLLGMKDEFPIDVDEMERKLNSPEYAIVARSLAEIGFYSATDLLATFAAQGPQLQGWLADAQVNRDKNLRLQYLAGLNFNRDEKRLIYSQIVANRRFPESFFTGSPETLETLRTRMMGMTF